MIGLHLVLKELFRVDSFFWTVMKKNIQDLKRNNREIYKSMKKINGPILFVASSFLFGGPKIGRHEWKSCHNPPIKLL